MLRSGSADYSTPLLVIGPGTGLGVAALAPVGDDVKIIEGEGGHVSTRRVTQLKCTFFEPYSTALDMYPPRGLSVARG